MNIYFNFYCNNHVKMRMAIMWEFLLLFFYSKLDLLKEQQKILNNKIIKYSLQMNEYYKKYNAWK
jgi:hypothetical protein